MLQYQGWHKGVEGNLFSLGGSEPLGLLVGLWTCDLDLWTWPKAAAGGSAVALPDEDLLKVLAKERSNLQGFFSQILMLVIRETWLPAVTSATKPQCSCIGRKRTVMNGAVSFMRGEGGLMESNTSASFPGQVLFC